MHLGMSDREAHAARVILDLGQPEVALAMHQRADQSQPARRVGHLLDLFGGHTYGDELFEPAIVPQHAQGGVLSPSLFAGQGSDAFQ